MIDRTMVLQDHNFPVGKADALNEIVGLIEDWVFDQYGDLDIEEVRSDMFDAGSGYRGLSFPLGVQVCSIMKLPADTTFSIAHNGADLRVCFTDIVTADLQSRSAHDLAQLAADLRLYYSICSSAAMN